jgi:seryl-tRNA synthetase
MSVATGTSEQQAFLLELIAHGLYLPSGEPGIYGRSSVFEQVRTGFDALVSRTAAPDSADTPRFPPIIPKRTLERAGYLKSFPNLCGSVFSFAGNEFGALDLVDRAQRGDDWSMHLQQTDVVLVPAACYPAYPAMAQRGPLPPNGLTLDLGASYVFRNEPSGDPARLQMFHQREMVRMGNIDHVLDWRERWMQRAAAIFEQVDLDFKMEIASDPFFGRGGRLLAKSQRELGLKFEVLVPIASPERTAVSSFNYHQDHFGATFDIQQHNGSVAHTACLGFGLERITLALFRRHGLDPAKWPAPVQEALRLA